MKLSNYWQQHFKGISIPTIRHKGENPHSPPFEITSMYKNAKQMVIQCNLYVQLLTYKIGSSFQTTPFPPCLRIFKQAGLFKKLDILQRQCLVQLGMMPKDNGQVQYPTISNFCLRFAKQRTIGHPWKLSQHPMQQIEHSYISATSLYGIWTQSS